MSTSRRICLRWSDQGLTGAEFEKANGLWQKRADLQLSWPHEKGGWTTACSPHSKQDLLTAWIHENQLSDQRVFLLLPRSEVVMCSVDAAALAVNAPRAVAAEFFPWSLEEMWWNSHVDPNGGKPSLRFFGLPKKRVQEFEDVFQKSGLPVQGMVCEMDGEAFEAQLERLGSHLDPSDVSWLLAPSDTRSGQSQFHVRRQQNGLAGLSVALMILGWMAGLSAEHQRDVQLEQDAIRRHAQASSTGVVHPLQNVIRALPRTCRLTDYRYDEGTQTIAIRGTAPGYSEADDFFKNLKKGKEEMSIRGQKTSLNPASGRVEFSGEVFFQ